MSLMPPPPRASTARIFVASRLRNKLTWCIEPPCDAAKRNRSDGSTERTVIGWGKRIEVRRQRVERSQICAAVSQLVVKNAFLRPTLTEWSNDAVNIRQDGKKPTPQATSVTGRVCSVKEQYGVGISACRSSSNSL